MAYFPFFMDVEGSVFLIAGGGRVAARKVQTMLEYGAAVRVIAPEALPEIRELAKEGVIEYVPRKCTDEDVGRAEVRCENLRGNVQTRLGKLESGLYDGIILAAAGLKRLGLLEDERYEFQFLECEDFIPAGGQGILAVEGRADSAAAEILKSVSHEETWLCLNLERRVLKLLDAGCHEPIGIYSRLNGGMLEVFGISGRGGKIYRTNLKGTPEQAEELACRAAEELGGR